MIPLVLLLAASTPSPVAIEVDCGGGIRPSRHRVFLKSDGMVEAIRLGYAAGHAVGHVDPGAVLALSARLDTVRFDTLSSPKPKYQVYDGTTCTIGRTTSRGYHQIVFAPGSTVPGRLGAELAAVRVIMDDVFKLADSIEPKPTP